MMGRGAIEWLSRDVQGMARRAVVVGWAIFNKEEGDVRMFEGERQAK